MSSGMYHKRWANAGSDDTSTRIQHNENVTQVIAPHTYGTSWNSVRWNKSLKSDSSDGYWNRSISFFEPVSKDYNINSPRSLPPRLGHFSSQPASKKNNESKNSGPYTRERSVRFGDSMLSVMNDKTSSRTSRQIPWLSDILKNRTDITYNKFGKNCRESANSRWTPTSSSATRSFQSGIRNTVPALSLSSASTLLHDRPFLSNTSQIISSYHGNAALKADRPWRRRMADAARLRNINGSEISGAVHSTLAAIRARRSSIPNGRNCINNSGDELRCSLNALKNYVDEQTTSFYRQNNRSSIREFPINSVKQHTPTRGFNSIQWKSERFPEYMSRSYSPIRPRPNTYNTKLSKYNSISTDMLLPSLRFPSNSNINNLYETAKSHVLSQIIRNSPIPENICERESSGRLLSNKERTLRHQSRQRKLALESDTSSDTEQRTEFRKRKLRKRQRKKPNDEDKSKGKLLLTSTEKEMIVTDDEISMENNIEKDNDIEDKEIQQNQILDNSEISSSISFLASHSEKSELRIIPTECNEEQSEEGEKEKEEKSIKELPSFVKSKKSTKKSNDKTPGANCINHKKQIKNTTAEGKKGNKYMECNGMSMEMQKMANIHRSERKPADQKEKFCSDQFAPQLSLLTMGNSTGNLIEACEKHHDNMAYFDLSAPVPGVWSGPDYHEMNISHNKQLQRDEACNNALGVITKKYTFCAIPAVTVCAAASKVSKPVEITLSSAFRPVIVNNEKVSLSMKYPRIIEMDKKLSAIINSTIKFDASFTSRIQPLEDTFDIIKMKRKHSTCSLTVKEPSIRLITIRESIFKRSDERNSCRAQVIVLTSPITDVNFYRCLKHVQVINSKCYPASTKKISKQACTVEENNIKHEVTNEVSCLSDQLPSWKVTTDEALSKSDEFMLSDHSLLEKYVKYKRDKLERLRSEPMEFDSRESSCSLAASELMRACAVRILEPTRQKPYITAPSRSRLGSVEMETVSTPIQKTSLAGSTKMLDLLSYGEQLLAASYHGLKSSPAIRTERSMSLTKHSFEFDAPMSPFEQRLQNQAFQLRKISNISDSDSPSVEDTPVVELTMQLPVHNHNRYPSVEGSSLTSNFTAAVAAAAQPRHERYAAHIPVTRVDGSGRQSTISIDFCNSGTVETNLQLDQMIDQARYKHYQHRNKFKEAIDYLDQIFEDLKKEGDQVDKMQRSREIPIALTRKGTSNDDLANGAVPSVKLQQHNANAKREVMEEMDSQKIPVVTTNRHSLHASKSKIAEKHCLQEKAISFEQTLGDVETSETIVLPVQKRKLKGERMDFTRRWLTGDIKSLVSVQPKPDLILGGVEEESDIDEHSLGSCSAEVAAINSVVVRKKKKASDVPDLIQNVASTAKCVRNSNVHQMDPSMHKYGGGKYLQQTDPIKPRAVKAQIKPIFPTGSTGTLNNFNNFSQSFRGSNIWTSNYDINSNQIPLQRISSLNRMSEQKYRDFSAISWGSTSQNPRQSSVPSEEIQLSTQKPGAFTPLQPPSIVMLRGSVASLPDSSNIRPQPLHSADPIVTIDALVAELELNTDQTLMASKRRSFPTGNEFLVHHAANYEKPISSQQVEHNSIQSSAKTKSEQNRTGHKQQSQKVKESFNEMTNMLQNVINDVTASKELPKGRKYVQLAVKNSSMLSPFETINQEKLNPSKVEAMQSIFENKRAQQSAPVWRCNGNNGKIQSVANVKDDDVYNEINDFGVARKEVFPVYAKPSAKQSSSAVRTPFHSKRRFPSASALSRSEFIPAFPVTHPPSHPPGSTNSSQTGGYYSSGSSLDAQSSYASPNSRSSIPREPILRKQSVSSHVASLDEEDDGFYDNIQMDEKRFSRDSELDSVSACSHRLLSSNARKPPDTLNKSASNRIGQFLRKIGASKPPTNAASLVSLNKVASEIMPTRPIPLMKSNSMSYYPGKKHVVKNINGTAYPAMADKRGGLGQRLKNSIFGSKKRLN